MQHLFTKPLKTLRTQVDARRLGRENKMAEEFVREGLPNNSGSEKEIIEYYFHRGFQYKNIVLLLEKYHGIRLSERTLKRKLKDFGLKRHEPVDENIERRVRNIIKADFHSAENIARSTFSAHFLLNCSNQIQISEHISKESEREKSIA